MIPDKVFYEYRYIWAYFCLEYLISVPYSFISTLNNFAQYQNGNVFSLMIVLYCETTLLFKGPGSMLSPTPFSKRVFPLSWLYFAILTFTQYYLQSLMFENKLSFSPPLKFWEDFIMGYKPHILAYRIIT